MILYKDNSKNTDINLRIGTGKAFSYKELQTFYDDGLLEDYDLFQVSSKLFDDVYMYYKDGEYYLISKNKNIIRVDPELLMDRQFVVASKCITNNVQHYQQLHGSISLDNLTQQEQLKIIMGPAYTEPEEIDLAKLKSTFDGER